MAQILTYRQLVEEKYEIEKPGTRSVSLQLELKTDVKENVQIRQCLRSIQNRKSKRTISENITNNPLCYLKAEFNYGL